MPFFSNICGIATLDMAVRPGRRPQTAESAQLWLSLIVEYLMKFR